MEFAPLWVRARGGAVGKRAAGGKRLPQLGEDKEEERSGVDVDEDSSQTEGEEEEQEVVDDGAVEADHDDEEEDSGPEETTAEGGGGGSTATAAAATAGESAAAAEISVLETLDLKTVLPLAIKQGAFFLMARWLGKNLRPEVESQVRAARAIYTAYLIFSQGLCMYIRCVPVVPFGVLTFEWCWVSVVVVLVAGIGRSVSSLSSHHKVCCTCTMCPIV